MCRLASLLPQERLAVPLAAGLFDARFTYSPSPAIIIQALSPSYGNKANAETIERYVKQRS